MDVDYGSGTLDEMLDDVMKRFGLPVSIGDVVYSSLYDAFIGSSTKGGLIRQEMIEGVLCHKLDYVDNLVQVSVWVPTAVDSHCPAGSNSSMTLLILELDRPLTGWIRVSPAPIQVAIAHLQ